MAQPREIAGHLLSPPPKIDGTIGDEEWAEAPSVEGLFNSLDDTPAPDKARFWVAYDEIFIYFAARLDDSQPNQIRATEYRTNVGLSGDDTVGIALDLGGSGTDFNSFDMNARGGTNFFLSGGRAAKREWTGEFLAKGRITETGWEAEARIPWQLFKLPSAGKRDLRIGFSRYIARTQRSYQFTKRTDDQSGKYPFWKGVAVPAQSRARSLKLLPYSYFGYDHDDHILNSGLDLKTQLTDQLELVGSINPDFRNIESEVLSLDFSRFERLAADSRPFFQEGSGYLYSPLFASQRIDNFDVGLNLYGRLSNKTSFGVLNATDWDRRAMGDKRETRNNLVATLAHSLDPTFSVRVGATSLQSPTLSNDAFYIRAGKQWGDLYVSGQHQASKDSIEGYGKSQNLSVSYTRRNLYASASVFQADPHFAPRLGFAPDRNYKGASYNLSYDRIYDKGALDSWGMYFGGSTYNRPNNDFYRRSNYLSLYSSFRNGFNISGQASLGNFEGVDDELYSIYLSFPNGNPYRNASISYGWGHQAGLPYDTLYVGGTYRTLGRLQASVGYQRVNFDGPADQLISSFNYDMGGDRSLAGRLVHTDGDTNFYIALKQSGNLGTEYYLILGDPNARTFRSSIILKVTVPFEISLGSSKTPKKQTLSQMGRELFPER